MKGLLSNINPKIHFFNYSADVNPFLHCGSGIIDANFKWECLKKKSEVIWRHKFVQRWCPNYFLPFLDQQVSCFYETAESISVKTVQIHGICTRYSESLISEFSLSVLILSCSLSFNSPRNKGKKNSGAWQQSCCRNLDLVQVISHIEALLRKPSVDSNQYQARLIFSFERDLLHRFLPPVRLARC